jgi:uncharacterized protein
VEWLLDTGDVICARRVGWRRVYDLPERVLPDDLLGLELSGAQCLTRLAQVTARALGVVTHADLSDYQRISFGGAGLRQAAGLTAAAAAEAAGLVPVEIAAGRGAAALRAWADPTAVQPVSADAATAGGPAANGRPAADLAAGADSDQVAGTGPATGRGRHRTTLLSPFDSLVWDRKRTLRVFGFEHSLEAYVPRDKRVHGYFTMPLLAGGRLVGRVDPAREGRTLIARKLSMDKPAAAEHMAQALVEAASWVGCDAVRLEQVEPAHLESRLRSALAARGA